MESGIFLLANLTGHLAAHFLKMSNPLTDEVTALRVFYRSSFNVIVNKVLKLLRSFVGSISIVFALR